MAYSISWQDDNGNEVMNTYEKVQFINLNSLKAIFVLGAYHNLGNPLFIKVPLKLNK